MSTNKSMGKLNSRTCLHITKLHHPFQPNISANLGFKRSKNCNLRSKCLTNTSLLAKNGKIKRSCVVRSSVEPGPPTPSGPPSNPSSWILGILISVVLPIIGYRWSPLLRNRFDTMLRRAEDVVEGIEKVAEDVERVAEDIVDDLPAGGQLRNAVEFIENVADKVAKKAGFVDDIIEKVEKEEEKMESSVEDKEKEKETESESEPKPESESETKNDSN